MCSCLISPPHFSFIDKCQKCNLGHGNLLYSLIRPPCFVLLCFEPIIYVRSYFYGILSLATTGSRDIVVRVIAVAVVALWLAACIARVSSQPCRPPITPSTFRLLLIVRGDWKGYVVGHGERQRQRTNIHQHISSSLLEIVLKLHYKQWNYNKMIKLLVARQMCGS